MGSRDDDHAMTNYVCASLNEIGALGEQEAVSRHRVCVTSRWGRFARGLLRRILGAKTVRLWLKTFVFWFLVCKLAQPHLWKAIGRQSVPLSCKIYGVRNFNEFSIDNQFYSKIQGH